MVDSLSRLGEVEKQLNLVMDENQDTDEVFYTCLGALEKVEDAQAALEGE